MDLLGQWRRRVFGAAAGAVVAPAAIVGAALVVGVGGGGLGSLGSVTQAFRGPEAPSIAPPTGAGPRESAEEAGRLLSRLQRRTRRTAARVPLAGSPGPGNRRRTPTGPGGNDGPGSNRRPSPTGSKPPSSTPAPTPPPQQPTPEPTPSTIRQVGDQVKEVTDPIPVAGPPAGEVVDLIVETAESLPLP